MSHFLLVEQWSWCCESAQGREECCGELNDLVSLRPLQPPILINEMHREGKQPCNNTGGAGFWGGQYSDNCILSPFLSFTCFSTFPTLFPSLLLSLSLYLP